MGGSVLLDTNIVIALFAKDLAVTEKLSETEEVFVSSPVLGELYFGARNSSRVEENVARIAAFAQSSAVLRCDGFTAEHYGCIKHQLKVSGTPIPENDIWISAIATQFGLVLISRDKHFGAVEGLIRIPLNSLSPRKAFGDSPHRSIRIFFPLATLGLIRNQSEFV